MKKFFLSILFVISCIVFGSSQVLERSVLCKSVQNNEPVTETVNYLVGEKAYCWIKLSNAPIGQSISVEWYNSDAKVYTSKLKISYASMRTYTYKTVHSEGNWKAVIKSASGLELQTLEFAVGSSFFSKNEKKDNKANNNTVSSTSTLPTKKKEIKPRVIEKDELPRALVLTPENFDPKRKYPVLIALPFTGGSGNDYMNKYMSVWNSDLENKNAGFQAYMRELYPDAKQRNTNAFILILTSGKGSSADHSASGFAKAINRYDNHIQYNLSKIPYADLSKVYLTGFSLGGDIAWALTNKYPNQFKGAILAGTRCSATNLSNMNDLKENDVRFFMAMGENELAARKQGMSYAKNSLSKYEVKYQYYVIPNAAHNSIDEEGFKHALKYVFD